MLIVLTVLNAILMISGQIMWKLGVTGKDINGITDLLKLFLNPFIFIGIVIYACATGLWIYILNKGELSYVYPIQSIAFIFALIAGVTIFKENISMTKIIGTCFICLGVIILTRK